MDSKTKALDIVMQQLLKADQDDYRLYGVHVSEFRSDAKGVLGLRTACKTFTEHNARQWMWDMRFCIAENLEEVRMQSPGARYSEHEVMVLQMTRDYRCHPWCPYGW